MIINHLSKPATDLAPEVGDIITRRDGTWRVVAVGNYRELGPGYGRYKVEVEPA